jgi:soluble lytic murein transglycosylase-like protein
MKILRVAALLAAGLASPQLALAGEADYAEMVAAHARANGVPEALVHRVIMRESRYQPHLIGHGGTIGLMQIKLATARGLGYTGDAAGLRDPDTNLTYAVKYLAGAYHAANGDHARAIHYYAGGYYYAAKRQRQEAVQVANVGETWLEPNGNPQPMFGAVPHRRQAQRMRNARAQELK